MEAEQDSGKEVQEALDAARGAVLATQSAVDAVNKRKNTDGNTINDTDNNQNEAGAGAGAGGAAAATAADDSDSEFESVQQKPEGIPCCCCFLYCKSDRLFRMTCCGCIPIKAGVFVIGLLTIFLTVYEITYMTFLTLND